jgi:acetyl esterase/lipase
VLRYRHGPRYHYPTTLLDAQRALRLIRARAQEYRVDPPYVPDATDGVSARPSFVLLLYPVIDLSDDAVTHRGSRTNLAQDKPILYDALSPQKHVTRDTPPVFMVHGTNDRLVPVKNSLLFYEACLKAGVPIQAWPEQALRFMARHGASAKQ